MKERVYYTFVKNLNRETILYCFYEEEKYKFESLGYKIYNNITQLEF